MESNDTRRESPDPYDFQTRHDNASFNDSSEENIATEKDLEADLERHGDGTLSAVPPQPREDANLVEWDGPDDPENPMNWSKRSKWTYTLVLSSMTLCITFSSSVFSTATFVTAKEFGVSEEVALLGTSLFVLVGPLLLPSLIANTDER